MTNDHDLLIEVSTKLSSLLEDVKGMRDNMTSRINNLESQKVGESVFNEYKINISREINHNEIEHQKELSELKTNLIGADNEQDKRIAQLERFQYIAIGIVAVLQILIPFAIRYIFKV